MTRVPCRRPLRAWLVLLVVAAPAIIGGTTTGPCAPSEDLPPGTGNAGLTGDYVGADRCQPCHTNIHNNWAETLHAGALETLEAIGQGTNPNCIGCHTVGFGEEGGFVDRATTNALAGVGCEACHGPARDHVMNVSEEDLRPPITVDADMCGKCHQGSHHPNFEQWSESGHAGVDEHVAEGIIDGSRINSCGVCHSGDARLATLILGESLPENAFAGASAKDLNGVTCQICHDPHERTGFAVDPGPDRDFQLRYPEVASPTPSNSVAVLTDPTRYNLCGQCHHDRGTVWTSNSRGPHHSIQSNVYIGELPMPEGEEPFVPNTRSVHRFVVEQCATCHMFRKDFESELAPAISGHGFEVNTEGCSGTACHPSEADALAVTEALQTRVRDTIDALKARMGDPSTWQYSGEGGPQDQNAIPVQVRKVRFILAYVEFDGSFGVHNPGFVNLLLLKADELLDEAGL